jgi:hypothetical protein
MWAGAISDVSTWRGALTGAQVADLYGGNPAVEWRSSWGLNGAGGDSVGSHPLTLVGAEGVDYEWVQDRTCFPWSALGLRVSGQGYARTAGPVLTTDESYTVAAWVKPDSLTGTYQTFLSQSGTGRGAFYLQVTPDDRWRFSLPQLESGTTSWVGAETEAGTAEAGGWTHLTGVFDIGKGEVRLYVNGELAATGPAVDSPWHANGPFYIGAGGAPGGIPYQPVHGSIDGVSAWSSTLDPDRIFDLGMPVLGGGLCS